MTIGSSERAESAAAGQQCGERALPGLAGGPGWALAFCGGRHEPDAFLQGLREILGPVPVVGGAGVGAMTSDMLGATGYECAIAVFSGTLPAPCFARAGDLGQGEREAGRQLANGLLPRITAESTILLFYDPIHSGPPPVLHVASRLVDGPDDVFDAALDGPSPTVIGGGTLRDFELRGGYVFDGDKAARHAAIAVLLPDTLVADTTIMHGCSPASAFLEITRIDGAEVYELDGRRAIDVLADKLGVAAADLTEPRVSLALTLGEKRGDPYAPFDERNYVNRLVTGADPASGSVTLFEADFTAGTRVQVMVTDADRMCASVEDRTRELLAREPDWPPVLALYVDCAGRASAFSGSPVEEAGIVRKLMGQDIPWFGFYSGVELAPLLGRTRPLDWTGALTVFRRRR